MWKKITAALILSSLAIASDEPMENEGPTQTPQQIANPDITPETRPGDGKIVVMPPLPPEEQSSDTLTNIQNQPQDN